MFIQYTVSDTANTQNLSVFPLIFHCLQCAKIFINVVLHVPKQKIDDDIYYLHNMFQQTEMYTQIYGSSVIWSHTDWYKGTKISMYKAPYPSRLCQHLCENLVSHRCEQMEQAMIYISYALANVSQWADASQAIKLCK